MPAQAFEYVEEQEHRHGAMTSLISITRMGEGERLVSRQLVGHIPCPLYVKAGEAEDGLYNLKMNLSWTWDKKQHGKPERALIWVSEDMIPSTASDS